MSDHIEAQPYKASIQKKIPTSAKLVGEEALLNMKYAYALEDFFREKGLPDRICRDIYVSRASADRDQHHEGHSHWGDKRGSLKILFCPRADEKHSAYVVDKKELTQIFEAVQENIGSFVQLENGNIVLPSLITEWDKDTCVFDGKTYAVPKPVQPMFIELMEGNFYFKIPFNFEGFPPATLSVGIQEKDIEDFLVLHPKKDIIGKAPETSISFQRSFSLPGIAEPKIHSLWAPESSNKGHFYLSWSSDGKNILKPGELFEALFAPGTSQEEEQAQDLTM